MQLLTTFQAWPVGLQTVLLLLASNVFMTFAWYGHLRSLSGASWFVAALVSWLCTDDCSFSTGAVFDLSGGRSTY